MAAAPFLVYHTIPGRSPLGATYGSLIESSVWVAVCPVGEAIRATAQLIGLPGPGSLLKATRMSSAHQPHLPKLPVLSTTVSR